MSSIVKKIEEVEEKQANDAGMQAAALSSVTVVSRMRGVFCFLFFCNGLLRNIY